jgi:hypothetical protein
VWWGERRSQIGEDYGMTLLKRISRRVLRVEIMIRKRVVHLGLITLIFTRHAYLASGHLRFLIFQNTAEQLFLKTPFIKTHTPYSITARVYTLVDPRKPMCTYKSTEKGKLMT